MPDYCKIDTGERIFIIDADRVAIRKMDGSLVPVVTKGRLDVVAMDLSAVQREIDELQAWVMAVTPEQPIKWEDIEGKPTRFPTDPVTVTWDSVVGKPTVFTSKAPTWSEVTGKPTTFGVALGTTSTTAKAGDWKPTYADVTGADAGVRNAMKTKPEIAALSLAPAGLDLSVLLGKVNAIITALKT